MEFNNEQPAEPVVASNEEGSSFENVNSSEKSGGVPVTRVRVFAFVFGIFVIAASLFMIVKIVTNTEKKSALTLYFSDFSCKKLVPVQRAVRVGDNKEEKLAAVLRELVYGPVSNATKPTLPAGLKVINCWVSGKIAYVNVGRKIRFGLSENADAEIVAVYSIVNSVIDNLDDVQQVQILVDDVPLRTIRGLTRTFAPLEKREDLVVQASK